jgi:hypothetical protein
LSLCFVISAFQGMALPSSSGEPNLLGPIDQTIPQNVVITKHRDDG